jgi:hypothetical protein
MTKEFINNIWIQVIVILGLVKLLNIFAFKPLFLLIAVLSIILLALINVNFKLNMLLSLRVYSLPMVLIVLASLPVLSAYIIKDYTGPKFNVWMVMPAWLPVIVFVLIIFKQLIKVSDRD